MRFVLLVLLIAATAAPALSENPPVFRRDLSSRDDCVMCDECFGPGYRVCSLIGCYNPNKAEQCCADAAICIGKDNSCCEEWGGPGVSGSANQTPLPTESYTPSYTPTVTGNSWECTRAESGEDCCGKGGSSFCGGKFPNYMCFNSTVQTCCSDGMVCDSDGCCELRGSGVSAIQTASIITTPPSTNSASGTAGTTAPATGTTSGTSSPNIAAAKGELGAAANIVLGILGLVAWL